LTRSLTDELRASPPGLHGEGDEYWGLAWAALRWLEENVTAGMATLETGAGSSTIVFAAAGAEHEAVTPDAEEESRIRRACERLSVDSSSVTFRIGPSHEVLPSLEPRELDLVLVDGAHGFPYPILDWWFLAPRLRVGGLMLLDDAYMPPVRVVVDALHAQPAWEVAAAIGQRTVALRKLSDELPHWDWTGERVGGRMSFRYLPPAKRAAASATHRAFTTDIGLRAVAFARRKSALRWRKRG
jgi:Methyltransferase domain